MIKLNNKNITYVALADSNNSIKAPKEIWYADSNNSVKLVYRRKDALIEGEDYEKYHWVLTDTGTPYIQVANGYNTDNDAYWETTFKGASVNGDKDIVIGFGSDNSFGYRLFVGGQAVFIDIHKRTSGVLNSKRLSFSYPPYQICHVFVNPNRYEFNNVVGTYELGNGFDTEIRQPFTRIFTNQSNNDMHYAETKMRVNNVEYDLIPCKLLKPVPKWLDANGIRRQVGECGMIDLVSGKFYGNVNSVGTFTVENYYERKEWLIGDGSAYIDTLHLANEGLLWETHVSNLSFKKYFVWNRVVKVESPAIALYHSAITNGTVCIQNNYTNSIVLQNQTDYDYIVAINSNGAVINGVQYIGQSASENISNKSIKLFYCDINEESKIDTIISNGNNSQDVKCAYFRFLDSNRNYIQNLIPCTLTMDLPASMDANSIARTKGTSGMWDLVSDRFYGNVANSGTFKAVNLAEGVDYEVHQWLVANGDDLQSSGSQNVALFSFPSDVNLVGKTVQLTMGAPCRDIYVYRYVNAGLYLVLYVWNGNVGVNSNNQTILSSPLVSQEPMVLDFENNLVSYNGQQIQITGDSFYIYFPSAAIEGKRKYGRIYCQGLFDFIPVKLLRSIPSKYDANGIVRQAGECGMYDTVNDVFYGNVASSGTFSVSDDS